MLDFINGGHLFFNLYRAGIFDEELARLYAAEIVLAVAHLHKLGFIHRDLKPENVLLDSEGHIKVTDFGLAKGGLAEEERTNSFIGTMEYMAPEARPGFLGLLGILGLHGCPTQQGCNCMASLLACVRVCQRALLCRTSLAFLCRT